jgi:hypothetical protein
LQARQVRRARCCIQTSTILRNLRGLRQFPEALPATGGKRERLA